MDDNTHEGIRSGPLTIAGTIPPKFQRTFVESSLRDAAWLRLPLPGARCPLTGLSRTTLIELGDRGEIVMKRIVKPQATRGIVIINKQSLLDYLERLESAPAHAGQLCPA